MASTSVPADSDRMDMRATSVVNAATEWEERGDGSRRPSDRPQRDEATGMPLWQITVVYTRWSYGRASSTTAMVTVPVEVEPVFDPYTPVTFSGLVVEVRTNKAGALIESWRADAITSGLNTAAAARNGRGRVEAEAAA